MDAYENVELFEKRQQQEKDSYEYQNLQKDQEWISRAEYGRYLSSFYDAIVDVSAKDQTFSMQNFLARHSNGEINKSNVQSIFLNAVSEKNSTTKQETFDRHESVRKSLIELKGLE